MSSDSDPAMGARPTQPPGSPDARWRGASSAHAAASVSQQSAGPVPPTPERSEKDWLSTFFGGNPAAVLFRLVLLSIVVGVIFAVLGLDPRSLFEALTDLVRTLIQNSAELIEAVVRYFLLGAAIVFPIWLVLRLFNTAARRR